MTGRCANCGNEFTKLSANQLNCSSRCKTAGERKRRKQREGAPALPAHEGFESICHRVIHDPKLNDLLVTANDYVLGYATKPSIFSGRIPAWNKPAGVAWFQGTDGRWMMEASASSDASPIVETQEPEKKKYYSVMRDLLGGEAPEDIAARAASAGIASGKWEMKETKETMVFAVPDDETPKPRTNAAFKGLDEDE